MGSTGSSTVRKSLCNPKDGVLFKRHYPTGRELPLEAYSLH